MSLLERIFPHKILTYDWVVVCTDHPEFMHNLCRRSELIRLEHTHHSEFLRVATLAANREAGLASVSSVLCLAMPL
jgi:hypothetical protein